MKIHTMPQRSPEWYEVRRGRYQLRYKNGSAKNFDTIDECLVAWAREYDCSQEAEIEKADK